MSDSERHGQERCVWGGGRSRDPAGCVSSREERFSARESYTYLASSKGDLMDHFSNLVNYKNGIIQWTEVCQEHS